jgi:hypothetical protein
MDDVLVEGVLVGDDVGVAVEEGWLSFVCQVFGERGAITADCCSWIEGNLIGLEAMLDVHVVEELGRSCSIVFG